MGPGAGLSVSVASTDVLLKYTYGGDANLNGVADGDDYFRIDSNYNKSGTSVVIATHDIALMDQYDARRLVLHDGRLHIYD